MEPEEIIRRFPEYAKGFFSLTILLFLLCTDYKATGRLPERVMRTVQRRLLRGEGCCDSSDGECEHHHDHGAHKHGKHGHGGGGDGDDDEDDDDDFLDGLDDFDGLDDDDDDDDDAVEDGDRDDGKKNEQKDG